MRRKAKEELPSSTHYVSCLWKVLLQRTPGLPSSNNPIKKILPCVPRCPSFSSSGFSHINKQYLVLQTQFRVEANERALEVGGVRKCLLQWLFSSYRNGNTEPTEQADQSLFTISTICAKRRHLRHRETCLTETYLSHMLMVNFPDSRLLSNISVISFST